MNKVEVLLQRDPKHSNVVQTEHSMAPDTLILAEEEEADTFEFDEVLMICVIFFVIFEIFNLLKTVLFLYKA